MAERLVFIAEEEKIGVKIEKINFIYYTGFSVQQKQKSIRSLHESASKNGLNNILEVSTKSFTELGVKLSAFNLSTKTKLHNYEFTVERAFQASKVFEKGGPYTDILSMTSSEAKRDLRLKQSGNILNFKFYNYMFEKDPPTFFYDWLYINTLLENNDLIRELKNYKIFSDIEFNHNKSINCQAYSIALFKSMILNNTNIENLKDPQNFLTKVISEYSSRWDNVSNENIQSELNL